MAEGVAIIFEQSFGKNFATTLMRTTLPLVAVMLVGSFVRAGVELKAEADGPQPLDCPLVLQISVTNHGPDELTYFTPAGPAFEFEIQSSDDQWRRPVVFNNGDVGISNFMMAEWLSRASNAGVTLLDVAVNFESDRARELGLKLVARTTDGRQQAKVCDLLVRSKGDVAWLGRVHDAVQYLKPASANAQVQYDLDASRARLDERTKRMLPTDEQ